MKKMNFKLAFLAIGTIMFFACGSDDSSEEIDDNIDETSEVDISVLASKFYNTDALSVTFDDTWVTITSSDLPDHKSMYYPMEDPLYEAYLTMSQTHFPAYHSSH